MVCAEPVSGKKAGRGRGQLTEGKNVLAKMQQAFGPLGILHGYMENRVRVKVGLSIITESDCQRLRKTR